MATSKINVLPKVEWDLVSFRVWSLFDTALCNMKHITCILYFFSLQRANNLMHVAFFDYELLKVNGVIVNWDFSWRLLLVRFAVAFSTVNGR